MVHPRQWWPPQFGLRSLFVVTALVAVFFSITCVAGYIEASGTVVALTVLAGTIRYRLRGWFLVLRMLAAVAALGLLWFVAVDFSWFVDDCTYCASSRDIGQYRVYRTVVSQAIVREHPTLASRIAQDLGAPCPHKYERWHLCRWWGLLHCARPCFKGTLRLTNDERYNENIARIVRSKRWAYPGLGEEFRRKVLFEGDRQYFRQLIAELDQAKVGSPDTRQDPGGRNE